MPKAPQLAKTAPRSKKPLAAYLRLSVDRYGDKIGYEVQRQAIEAWADYAGETIGHWYQDKDLTAADHKVKRPAYEQMLQDIEDGQWGGVVVWKLDRLVRLMREFQRCLGIVQDTNGFIVCIDPMFRTDNEFGPVFMNILVTMAEMEVNTMRARQRGHQKLKAKMGKYSGGGERAFGFAGAIRDEEGRVTNGGIGEIGVKHVKAEVELLKEAARRIAYEGESYSEVLRSWAERTPPVLGTGGAPIASGTLADILISPRIAGLRSTEVKSDDEEIKTVFYKAEWDPIIDRETWERLKALKQIRGERGRPNSYLLSGGLVDCGKCGYRLIGSVRPQWKTNEPIRTYRCPATTEARARGACGGINILADPVEKIAVALMIARLEKEPNLLAPMESAGEGAALATALTTIGELETMIDNYFTLAGEKRWPPTRLERTIAPLQASLDEAQEVVERAKKRMVVPVPVGNERHDLLAWFEALNVTQRRLLISTHLASVSILPAPGRGNRFFNPDRVVVTPADSKKLN